MSGVVILCRMSGGILERFGLRPPRTLGLIGERSIGHRSGGEAGSVDARVYLGGGGLRQLAAPLWKFLPEVRARLVREGYSESALDCAERELRGRNRKLPPLFVRYIWPSVRQGSHSDALSLFLDLGLDSDDRLLHLIGRLFVVAGPERACTWGRIAECLPRERRAVLIEKLLDIGVCAPDLAVRETSLLATDEQFPLWMERLLSCLKRSDAPDYLVAGFRLAARFAPNYPFDGIGRCSSFPLHLVEEIGVELAEDSTTNWMPMALWKRCGELRALDNVLRNSRWREFTRAAARAYFDFLIGIGHCDLSQRTLANKWTAILSEVAHIESLIAATTVEYQEKAMECVSDWLWWWDDPVAIRSRLPHAYTMLGRLAALPFQTSGAGAACLRVLLELQNKTERARVLGAPDSSFAAVERACRRENDAVLLARGLRRLVEGDGKFAVDAFLAAPNALCRAARKLGSVSGPVGAEIVERCREHPLFALDPLSAPVERIQELVAGLKANPVPARLSAWVRGEIELTAARVERYRRVLAQKLVLTRLEVMASMVVERLRRGLPEAPIGRGEEHALLLLGASRDNRRGLRKFLKAYWAGEPDYLAKHPATSAWYRQHRAVSRSVWEAGIHFASGDLSIAVERDPLEVLKLGTYVGSCLGLGGKLSYSAIAALLDVNKQVVYAKDRVGRVVARQLVAISDDDRLVCFPVYPGSAGMRIQTLFREIDAAFAPALGLELYRGGRWVSDQQCSVDVLVG